MHLLFCTESRKLVVSGNPSLSLKSIKYLHKNFADCKQKIYVHSYIKKIQTYIKPNLYSACVRMWNCCECHTRVQAYEW